MGATKMTESNNKAEQDRMPDIVIVTGMSGAGRTEAMHVFEDLGYFCVDNLPSSLIGSLVDLDGVMREEGRTAERRLAVVCDARNRDFFGSLNAALADLRGRGVDYTVLFLDADDEPIADDLV